MALPVTFKKYAYKECEALLIFREAWVQVDIPKLKKQNTLF